MDFRNRARTALALASASTAVLLMASPTSFAQTPVPVAKPPTDAEAAAAMERAQRLASNPMRVILEASRVKTVRNDIGAQPPAAAPAPAAAAAAAAPVPAPRPPAEKVFSASGSPAPLATVDAIAGTGQASLPAFATAAPSLAALADVKPRLVSQVEPVFPAKLLDDAAKLTEVLADLTLATDGTVKDVTLLGNVARPLHRPIIAALEAWRFEPLPAPRVHRVQLVFTGDR